VLNKLDPKIDHSATALAGGGAQRNANDAFAFF